MKIKIIIMIVFTAFFIFTPFIYSQISIDLESGQVHSGYNDVRIPGDSGTLFSLSEELKTDPSIFFRAMLGYTIKSKHTVSLLYAPLTVEPKGQIDKSIIFAGTSFPAGEPLTATYTFNSYRLTYRYELVQSDKLEFGLGVTAKIRDAAIKLEGNNRQSEKTNTGFVPLINFSLMWKFHARTGLLVEGDALAAPQGRAEDVLTALTFRMSNKVSLKAGYRILEGGADNDEVYTFSLFNYAVAGLILEL